MSEKYGKFEGRVWKFGHNVDTDVIAPGKYLGLEMAQLASHALEILDPRFPKEAKPGDIVVGGRNFGCGSSREHAVRVFKALQINCILSETFARIFSRNCTAVGLPTLAVPAPFWEQTESGDRISVDLVRGAVFNYRSNIEFNAPPVPERLLCVLAAGGIMSVLKEIGKNQNEK